MNRTRSVSAQQRGISMVESLVALVVLSIGMLGIASLYVASLKANRVALSRTVAVNLVNDMADRIRANPSARGGYALTTAAATPARTNCDTAVCTDVNVAQDDLSIWATNVTNSLGGTNITRSVAYTAGGSLTDPDTYTITVNWTEAGETNAFTASTSMQMIPVVP